MARGSSEAAIKNGVFNEAALPAALAVGFVPPPVADAGAAATAAIGGGKRGASGASGGPP